MNSDDIRTLFADGFAYIPAAVPEEVLRQVDLGDEIFQSFDGYHGVARQVGWFAMLEGSDTRSGLWDIANSIENEIANAAASTEFADHLTGLRFNEITIQVYRPAFGEVGAHRDQQYYDRVFAILTLYGRGRFNIHLDNETRDLRASWIPNPGDLFLMRAGAGGAIHSVPEPSEERVTASFRHNTRGAKSGIGGTRLIKDGGIRGSELMLPAR